MINALDCRGNQRAQPLALPRAVRRLLSMQGKQRQPQFHRLGIRNPLHLVYHETAPQISFWNAATPAGPPSLSGEPGGDWAWAEEAAGWLAANPASPDPSLACLRALNEAANKGASSVRAPLCAPTVCPVLQ